MKQPVPAIVARTSRRLHRKEAATYLGVSLSWLDKSRLSGLGPVFVKIGSRILYESSALDKFLSDNRYQSTSQYGQG